MEKNIQLIVMGVSGCGKSTVAKAIAKSLNYEYIEGDDYHPLENIIKMQSGTPLNDDDRQGWLETLNGKLCSNSTGKILSCSALKQQYRNVLTSGVSNPVFLYLQGDFDTIYNRMQTRENHFFSGREMLQNQFETLVEPTGNNVITLDVRLTIEELVKHALSAISQQHTVLTHTEKYTYD
ncbi:MAG: gluconokinase [Gammaproteobacteria bacterium]|nr:gluconokinase [Gammaproteobacteria bacterium]